MFGVWLSVGLLLLLFCYCSPGVLFCESAVVSLSSSLFCCFCFSAGLLSVCCWFVCSLLLVHCWFVVLAVLCMRRSKVKQSSFVQKQDPLLSIQDWSGTIDLHMDPHFVTQWWGAEVWNHACPMGSHFHGICWTLMGHGNYHSFYMFLRLKSHFHTLRENSAASVCL